jgi:ABC-type amino acid transport substrate-binding protein
MKRIPLNRNTAFLIVAMATIVMAMAPAEGLGGEEGPRPLSFVYVQPESTPKAQWLIRIYTEALGRMGMEFKFVEVPAKRASLYSNSGRVDGELNRISTYGDLYPNMVMVPEPNLEGSFSAFTLSPTIHLDGWESLEGTTYSVGLLRGVVYCEQNLSWVLPEDQLHPVTSLDQGMRMLLDRRIDILVYNTPVTLIFLDSEEGKALLDTAAGHVNVYNSGLMGITHGHAWLHKSHADLAQPLAEVLRQMKAEGLFDLYSQKTGFHPNQASPKWVKGPGPKP